MIILGVTGSIGSGKSYFCKKLALKKGVQYISSDEMVHNLYAHNDFVFKFISQQFSEAIIENKIDRRILGKIVFADKHKRQLLENFVYPQLKKQRQKLIQQQQKQGTKILVLEIPLLFENNLQKECDYTLTIFCNKIIEEQRALKRQGMTKERLNAILKTQMSVSKKIKLSDFKINSGANISYKINWLYNYLSK